MSRVASCAAVGLCDIPGKSLCSELEKVNEGQKNGRELLKKQSPTQDCLALNE